jgi:hypothetical protein
VDLRELEEDRGWEGPRAEGGIECRSPLGGPSGAAAAATAAVAIVVTGSLIVVKATQGR